MASPFPANAVLVFQVSDGTMTTDPKTGNKKPGTEAIELKAYLNSDSRPRGLFYPGLDEAEEPLRGYIVEAPDGSSNLPSGIGHLSKGQVTITDPVTGATKSGIFTLYRGTPSPFGVEAATGAKISGVFRFVP